MLPIPILTIQNTLFLGWFFMSDEEKTTVPLQVIISREGKWFVASCPILDIATQGKDEREVKENIQELIEEYFQDPDTPKPSIKELMTSTVSVINFPVKVVISSDKASIVKLR